MLYEVITGHPVMAGQLGIAHHLQTKALRQAAGAAVKDILLALFAEFYDGTMRQIDILTKQPSMGIGL